MNIFEKLGAVAAEISAVAKNLNVGYGKSSYKAVGEADVLAAVKPAESKYKVYSYPVDREIVDSGVLTSIRNDGTESRQQFIRIRTVYRFIDMEKPESFVDVVSFADGVDPGDKAPGKAMTYADKYALLKAYKIITGDDPDQFQSEPLAAVETKPYPSRKEMIETCDSYYQGENRKKLLEYFNVSEIKYLNNGQLMTAYNKATGGKK